MKIRVAGCVILDDYGRILLLHNAASQASHWELPGGEIGLDETAVAAATRAVDEELGLAIELIKPLDVGMFEDDENEYEYAWFQGVITDVDPQLHATEKFDDLDYFELEDLPSLALSANTQIIVDKILSGDVALEA